MLTARLREQRADAFGPDASDAVVLACSRADPAGGERQAAMLTDELGRAAATRGTRLPELRRFADSDVDH